LQIYHSKGMAMARLDPGEVIEYLRMEIARLRGEVMALRRRLRWGVGYGEAVDEESGHAVETRVESGDNFIEHPHRGAGGAAGQAGRRNSVSDGG
jgi:hypothetical protein